MNVENRPTYVHKKTKEFLKVAIEEGAFVIPKAEKDTRLGATLAREHNILGTFYMSDAFQGEVGTIYKGVTRQAIQQVLGRGMRRVWDSCSPQIQEAFPFEDLPLSKPKSLRAREQASRSKGGIIIQIRDQIKQGITDIDEISRQTGLAKNTIRARRGVLAGWGVTLPFEHIQYKQVTVQIDAEEDNTQLQQILDGIPDISLIAYVNNRGDRKIRQGTFLLLRRLVREAGFHTKSLASLVKVLREAELPIRGATSGYQVINGKRYPLTYWFTLAKRKKEVLEVIQNSPEVQQLKVNPVQLIFGSWDGPFPTTTNFRIKRNYEDVGNIVREVTGLRPGGWSKLTYVDFLTGSPVPVFRNDNHYIFPSEMKSELRIFLEERFTELRSIGVKTHSDGDYE